MTGENIAIADYVGPVLEAGAVADAVIAAIRQLNEGVVVLNRRAYYRVSARQRCIVTRVAIEEYLGRSFHFPRDLEKIMPAFHGMFSVSKERAEWRAGSVG